MVVCNWVMVWWPLQEVLSPAMLELQLHMVVPCVSAPSLVVARFHWVIQQDPQGVACCVVAPFELVPQSLVATNHSFTPRVIERQKKKHVRWICNPKLLRTILLPIFTYFFPSRRPKKQPHYKCFVPRN